MEINFSTSDYLIILGYFVIVLFIGFKTKSSQNSVKEYLVAGRTLTLPAFVATLVSSFYGGILGIGEFTFDYGVSAWFLYAFPYYFFIVVFAFFLANKIRKAGLYTIPDKLYQTYGRKVGLVGAIFIFFLSTPAPYLFMMGILINLIFGLKLFYSMSISLILSIAYLFRGGLRSDVRVNIFEFILMYLGFGIIIPFCIKQFGGFSYLESALPPVYLSLTGGNSFQYILVWFFIGSWALVDPTFHQRCYAAKDKNLPKKGVLIALAFWFVFDFMTTTAGLYAKASLKELSDPAMSYPVLAESVLPPIAKGIFFIGMIATVMSSLHSYIFVSGTTFGRDIVSRIMNLENENNMYNKIGILISAFIALIIALLIPSVVRMWYTIGTLIIPALLISVISSYFNRLQINSKFILISMVSSFTVSFIFFILGEFNKFEGYPVYPLGIEPMYPGLLAGLIIYFFGYSTRRFLKTRSEY